ncbi:hypothetical protein NEOLI_003592 [Neolecta irregularis DAH-3]|uniref:Uncharacterized protein n=1 Tax=Neolecta irregularis (strain DAH-3) TaxID=1198029 RepID=A0A1U7LQE4_NEOID|nr:hypothetical protein NEOLI_003592 [Neolecta irregularis DAH-3]|eukprot:OLL24741.1 hypothetical protein NEOLI_003592 [Neolecta irregularis DAH-3]
MRFHSNLNVHTIYLIPMPQDTKHPTILTISKALDNLIAGSCEEGLYNIALPLLSCLITSREDAHTVPDTRYIVLLTTLLVHPSIPNTIETDIDIPSESFRILSRLLQTAGPRGANFHKVWAAQPSRKTRRRTKAPRLEGEGDNGTTGPPSWNDNIFNRVNNVWELVGWAFSSCCTEKSTWRRWILFLQHFVDLLERDWREEPDDTDGENTLLFKVLWFKQDYQYRTAIKATFAKDAGDDAAQGLQDTWKPIFERIVKRKDQEDERLAAGVYHVTFEQDEDQDDLLKAWGGYECLKLRIRFIDLFARAAAHHSLYKIVKPERLLDDVCAELSDFQDLLLFWTNMQDPDTKYALAETIFRTDAMNEEAFRKSKEFSEERILKAYLPAYGQHGSVVMNAMLGFLVGEVIGIGLETKSVEITRPVEFGQAVEEGIRERRRAAEAVRRKSVRADESIDVALAQAVLVASEEVLRGLARAAGAVAVE